MSGIWREINISAIKKAESSDPIDTKGPEACLEFVNRFLNVHSFSVAARDWKLLSGTNRYVGIVVPSITEQAITNGKVLVFLDVSGRQVRLPFLYHQAHGSACIRSVQEAGKVYISILGQFIPSVHNSFGFKVVVVYGKVPSRFKWLNWESYASIRKAFHISS